MISVYQFKGNSVLRLSLPPETKIKQNPKTTIKEPEQNLRLPHLQKEKTTTRFLCFATPMVSLPEGLGNDYIILT